MPVHNRIADFADEMTEWRRDLHAHPELAFQEHRTSDLVAERLASWGIEVTRGIAGTGLVGTLRNGQGTRAIGIRADMDALPMPEANDVPYRSQNEGVMHACGHDGHTTMLLGAAKYLAETRNFDGTVHFIFQPAEEAGGGGEVMVREGLFDRFPCDMVFGAHNDTVIPVGQILAQAGAVNANTDDFAIRIIGRGGHAAAPHNAIDPVITAAQTIIGLQTLVSRRTSPLDSVVISTCMVHAGTATNVIPDTAELRGTLRALKPETRETMRGLMRELAENIARANGATAEFTIEPGYPAVVNDAEAADRAALAAAKLVGESRVLRELPPRMGGEDFSFMAQRVPGCFVRIGQRAADKGGQPAHTVRYDFNDEILPIGASLWATIVEQELPRGE